MTETIALATRLHPNFKGQNAMIGVERTDTGAARWFIAYGVRAFQSSWMSQKEAFAAFDARTS